MKFHVQRDSAYNGNRARRRYRQLTFDKFNYALEALRQQTCHSRIVFDDDDNKVSTLVLWENPKSTPFSEEKKRGYVELTNKVYFHKQSLRKTSIRRT